MLTRACNLACGYCFAGEKKKSRLSGKDAERALDFAFERATSQGEPLEIAFFGGEPLLEWDAVVELAERARARAAEQTMPLALQLTTNGTLLDDAKVARLTELGVHVALSLDGTEEAHDRARPTAGGRGSFAQTSAALDRLLACGAPFDVITVVDPVTVDDLASGVRQLLDRGVTRLTLNPNWGASWTPERLARMRAEYEQLAAIIVAWFRRGRAVTVQPFDSAMVALASGSGQRGHACAAGVSSFAVGPSGRVYGCARAVGEDDGTRAMGSLDDGLDPERLALVGAPACPGACACACLEETGDARQVGPVQRFHDALVAELAERVARALEKEAIGRDTFSRTFRPSPSVSTPPEG